MALMDPMVLMVRTVPMARTVLMVPMVHTVHTDPMVRTALMAPTDRTAPTVPGKIFQSGRSKSKIHMLLAVCK